MTDSACACLVLESGQRFWFSYDIIQSVWTIYCICK